VGNGNATDCLRPIAFADDWLERRGPPGEFEFNSFDETTGLPLTGDRDEYTAPSATETGRTISLPPPDGDLGERIIWELDRQTITAPFAPITRGLVVALNLPGAGTFEEKIETCGSNLVELGQTLLVEGNPPAGQTQQAFSDLINVADPGATWHALPPRIDNSCAPGCASISPRLIPVALFDPYKFQLGRATGNWTAVGCLNDATPCITVTNIVGFFVHGVSGPYGPHGHFLKYPGIKSTTAPTPVLFDNASWTVTTHLFR
jgi:hypothetical protein